MFNHLMKFIWNRRKRNLMTSLGIIISFLVLFLVLTIIVKSAGNYFKTQGFNTDKIWFITFDWKDAEQSEIQETFLQINNLVAGDAEIENYSYARTYIYSPWVMSATNLEYNEKELSCHIAWGDRETADVLKIPVIEGRWFDESDLPDTEEESIVVSQKLIDEFFPDGEGIGKTIMRGDDPYRIIGIVPEFRNASRFSDSRRVFFRQTYHNAENFTDFRESMGQRILLKIPGQFNAASEMALLKKLNKIAPGWTFDVRELNALKNNATMITLLLPIILGIVSIFMLVNVGLGLFGVIWYQTERRKSEVGLRRALGAPKKQIYLQIIGEAIVLTTFSILWGILFAVQFPLLHVFPSVELITYMQALALAIVIIYGITFFCALYPSRQAINIEPAEALHYE
ncbi:MAG: ABC transporter permease [Candidatus Cloacimonetes bacterium]|nr:ABC transporter permease [Candidatus Cloacimonadota bacterium]